MKEVVFRCTGISVVLLRTVDNRVETLLLKRASSIFNHAWCYIGGGIEEGESAVEAALREIKEETGLIPEQLYTSNKLEQIYNPKENYIYTAPVFVGFVHENSEVKINSEHSEFLWLPIYKAIAKATIPGADEILTFIEKHFVQRKPLPYLLVRKEG